MTPFSQISPALRTFAKDVLTGLRQEPKRLSSKYFYDDKGSELFRQIMRMESYYLTDAELDIFTRQGDALADACSPDGTPFRLVEFGAGDGLKTKVLLRHLVNKGLEITYSPIDISQAALGGLVREIREEFPGIRLEPLEGDYFEALDQLAAAGDVQRKVVLFLGSNIGNFSHGQAREFLEAIRAHLGPGDRLIMGMDLMKDPGLILAAYDDPEGITREFNLNLLDRMNRELGANFDRTNWKHYATYDPVTGATKSYLISMRAQTVLFSSLQAEVSFAEWEPVWMELSQKYHPRQIPLLAEETGFCHLHGLLDSEKRFMDAIWEWN